MPQKKHNPKINLIFDLDKCLFNRDLFFDFIWQNFKNIGVSDNLFLKTYADSKTGPEKTWDSQLQLKLISEGSGIKIDILSKELEKIFKSSAKFLFSDVKRFLKKYYKKNNIFLNLLTHGKKNVQMAKIKYTGINNFFNKIYITSEEYKLNLLKKAFKKNQVNLFIDDREVILVKAKKTHPSLITILLRRNNFLKKTPLEVDFQVKDLKQVEDLISKIQKKPKCLMLFSGGLDSILAVKILLNQGVEVLGIIFKSYFFDEKQAVKFAKQIGLKYKVVDFSKPHLEIIKMPKFGYGKNLNPCIDCHLLMFKKTKEIMKKQKYDFIASGEVLGERPMSQTKGALNIMDRDSDLRGLILRPLSAQILMETIPEKLKWVNRQELQKISGRSRKTQLKLVKKYKIKEFPAPAGGCVLTEKIFASRLKEVLELKVKIEKKDIELLKIGRHFWINGKVKIIVGRNYNENEKIEKLKTKKDIMVLMKNYPGPTTLIKNYSSKKITKDDFKKIEKIIIRYSPKAKTQKNIQFQTK